VRAQRQRAEPGPAAGPLPHQVRAGVEPGVQPRLPELALEPLSTLEVARSLGATETVQAEDQGALARLLERGFDLVVDATGSPRVLQDAVAYARPNGVVWAFGVAPPGATVSVSPFELFRKDLTLFGSFALNRTFDEAIAVASTPGLELEALVSHVVPLAQFESGIHIARHEPRRMKVQFEMVAEEAAS